MKELEDLKQKIIEEKAILKEEGLSGGQINKHEKIVAMVTRLNELKEKQDPGSSKKEKDAKKDSKKKTPLSAEEQKEYAQLQGDIEVYKAKLRNEFGYSNKDMKADPDLKDMEARLAALREAQLKRLMGEFSPASGGAPRKNLCDAFAGRDKYTWYGAFCARVTNAVGLTAHQGGCNKPQCDWNRSWL